MKITRSQPPADRTLSLAASIAGLGGPCVGCKGCTGLCAALIDALTVPGIVLSAGREGR